MLILDISNVHSEYQLWAALGVLNSWSN